MTTITRLSAREVAAEVADLPSLSSSINDVIVACDDPDISVGRISQVIMRDQALTAGILRLANSAFYGHPRRINTISDASLLLGFSAIKSLAISAHTSRLLAGPLPGYGLQRGELWDHSVAVAFTSRRLALEVESAPVEEAFIAGLLHDIGKLILSSHMEDAFEEVVALAEERRVPLHEVEVELLGFDHAELGARIAAAWNFPPALEEAIRRHHDPMSATVKPALAGCVHVADAACILVAVGLDGPALADGIDPAVLAALELPPERFVRAIGDVADVIRTNPFGGV
jgi:putative nucleotidyltransferase with HDIG domain